MKVGNQIKLSFGGVNILNMDFSSKKPYEGGEINVECTPFAFFPKDKKDLFQILMEVSVSCEEFFSLSLKALGLFKINEDVDDDTKKIFINTNSAAIMYPYVRAFVSTFTINAGIGSIIIPPQFFSGELEVLKDEGGAS